MIANSLESLKKFIAENQLKRVDGNILFNGTINFYAGDTLHTVASQVQIILLPNEIAVYILEFLKESYQLTEMYSTSHYYFTCSEPNTLEIKQTANDKKFTVSIAPN